MIVRSTSEAELCQAQRSLNDFQFIFKIRYLKSNNKINPIKHWGGGYNSPDQQKQFYFLSVSFQNAVKTVWLQGKLANNKNN